MIKKIGFDIDGCLMDHQQFTVNQFLKLHEEMTGSKYQGKILLEKQDTRDMFPDCSKPAVMDAVHDSFTTYARVCPFESFVKRLFTELKKRKHELHIVTARTESDDQKLEELRNITINRFKSEQIPFDELHIGLSDKVAIVKASGIELMVEDTVENIIQLSEVIPVFKIVRPYNNLLFGSNIYALRSLYPSLFLDKLEYVDNHRNYLGLPVNLQEKPAIQMQIVKGNCIVNGGKLVDRVPAFIVPLSGEPLDETLVNNITASRRSSTIINLYDIDKPVDTISDPMIRNSIVRYCGNTDISAGNEITSDKYILRSKVIADIIGSAIALKQPCTIYGPQILQLERDILLQYEKYPFVFPNITENHRRILTESRYKKDYKLAYLLEDLDEISMNIRKLKIIAGTDPKRLPTYVNRQYFSSDGVDTVSLLSNERPYKLENLEAALSGETYVIGDCHLDPKDNEKTDMIANNINVTVRSTDTILFLGDFDAKGHTDKKIIKDLLRRISCKNVYMLVGNNDGFTIPEYAEMGFLGVGDVVTYKYGDRDVILSHCPVPVSNSAVNIHGHLHGGREYWNIDWHNHIDIWNEDFIPIKIRDAVAALDQGLYRAKSMNVSYI